MTKPLAEMDVSELLDEYFSCTRVYRVMHGSLEICAELERRIDSNRVQVHAPVERKPLAQMNFGELMSEFGRMDDETEIVRYQRDQVIDEIGSRRLGRNPK